MSCRKDFCLKKSIDYYLNKFDVFILKATADDPDLIRIVRNFWIRWPSKQPYNLDAPEKEDFSMGQSLVVDNLLKQKVCIVTKIMGYMWMHFQIKMEIHIHIFL